MRIYTILIPTIFLCSCVNNTDEKKLDNSETKTEIIREVKKIDRYFIDISANNLESNKINIEIKTSFPEGSELNLSVNRPYKRKNNPNDYVGEVYSNRKCKVINGSFNITFQVDDMKWMSEYKQLQFQYGKGSNELTDIIKTSIQDSLLISVLYTPKAEKSEEIKKIIGSNGEFLNGDGVEELSGFNVFRKEISIYNKRLNK